MRASCSLCLLMISLIVLSLFFFLESSKSALVGLCVGNLVTVFLLTASDPTGVKSFADVAVVDGAFGDAGSTTPKAAFNRTPSNSLLSCAAAAAAPTTPAAADVVAALSSTPSSILGGSDAVVSPTFAASTPTNCDCLSGDSDCERPPP